MEVYIEYVVIDNLVIDYLLILLTRKTLKMEISKFSVIFSALVGTVVAVAMPMAKLNVAFTYAAKIILAAIIIILSGKFNSLREYFRAYYLFIFYTFLFGGGVYAAFYFLNIDFSAPNFTYNAEFSLGAILFIAYAIYFSAYRLITYIYRHRDVKPYLRKCVAKINGNEITLTGFIDSGNRLFCKRTGCPVILCSSEVGNRLRSAGILNGVKSEIMSYYTAAGKSYVKIYKLDSLEIYNGERANKIYNVKIGVSPTDFRSGGEYDLLLNPALI